MRTKQAQSEFRKDALRRKLTAQQKQQEKFDKETERILKRLKLNK